MEKFNLPKGIQNKPKEPGNWIYIYPERVYSKDPNDPDYRFGVISFLFQNGSGQWLAVTVRQIFLKCWVPNNIMSVFGCKESTVGKDVFMFDWASEKRADISQDPTIITNKGHFGKIVRELDPMTVLIKVDDTVISTDSFKNEGFWTQMAR